MARKKKFDFKCVVGVFEHELEYQFRKNKPFDDITVTREEYEKSDLPEKFNTRADYIAKLRKMQQEGKCQLPQNWQEMSVEEACSYLTALMNEILDIDTDFDLSVSLQILREQVLAFVEFTDESCVVCSADAQYVHCILVRREELIPLAELSERCHASAEDQEVELVMYGKNFKDALENLFYEKILLIFHGYQCLYWPGDYAEWCKENNESDWDSDDEEDIGDD